MQKERLEFVLSVVSVSLFVLLLAVSAILLFRIYLKRKNTLLLEKERMSIQFEQTLLQSKLEMQEQTFGEISREIHDNIGQVLSLARINLNTLTADPGPDKINLVDELMEKAITDLRNLSHLLNTDLIRDKGWVEPLQRLLQDLKKTGKYETSLELEETLSPLGSDRPIILFRMIQEIVNNIIRHAKANRIDVSVQQSPGELIIRISDNGKGFDTQAAAAGVGIRNLQNRAALIKASLKIDSEPGNGTTVAISVNTENHD